MDSVISFLNEFCKVLSKVWSVGLLEGGSGLSPHRDALSFASHGPLWYKQGLSWSGFY